MLFRILSKMLKSARVSGLTKNIVDNVFGLDTRLLLRVLGQGILEPDFSKGATTFYETKMKYVCHKFFSEHNETITLS